MQEFKGFGINGYETNIVMKKVVLFIAAVCCLAACTDDYFGIGVKIVDEEFTVNYIVKNDTESQIKLVPHKNNLTGEIIIEPGETYTYWQEIMSGTLEPGKVALFRSDSLDIHFNDHEIAHVISGTVDASQADRMLEALWVSSEDSHTMTLTINDTLKYFILKADENNK